LAVAEAMAGGVPVVATAGGGIRDVTEDGKTAVLVEGADMVRLAEAIERVVADPELRKTLSRAGQRRAQTHLGIDDVITAHESLYREIAADLLHA